MRSTQPAKDRPPDAICCVGAARGGALMLALYVFADPPGPNLADEPALRDRAAALTF